jgi:thioesterase domain-containing protein
MGMIRKTLSVSTLGLVSFRSKKEKLARADRSRHEAEVGLEREHKAREAAEIRVAAAEKRVKHATSESARTAHRLEKVKRRNRRRAGVAELLANTEPAVRGGADAVRSAGSDAAKRGRKAGRRARRAAAKATVATKDAVSPTIEKAATRLGESISELTTH